jgi:predicted nucleic acid-binding protein
MREVSERVLVDSSGWTDFLRGRGRLAAHVLRLVAEDRVWLHPTVAGEVLLGGVDLADGRLGGLSMLAAFRAEDVLGWMRTLDPALLRGVGWADCEIAHAAVRHGVALLTADERQAVLFRASGGKPAAP